MSVIKSPKHKSLNKSLISSCRKPQLPPTLIKPNTTTTLSSSSLSTLPIDNSTNNGSILFNNSNSSSTSLELELDAFALTHQPILLTRKKAALNTSQKAARNPKINGFLPLTTTSSSNSSIDRIEEHKEIVNFIQSYHNTNATTTAITSDSLPSGGSGLLRPAYDTSNITGAAYDSIISSTIGSSCHSSSGIGVRKGVLVKSLKSLRSPVLSNISGKYDDKSITQSTDSLAIEGDSIEKNSINES